MRHLVELLNSFASSAARMDSGLPSAAAPPPPPPPPLTPAAAAARPVLAAAEVALAAKLAGGGAAADADYFRLAELNATLAQQRGFAAAAAAPELNRYCDVLPYDDNRVTLGAPGSVQAAAASGQERGGRYINASPLRGGGGPGGVAWHYLAAQGPLRHTREAFWEMALEEGVGAVVMLTNIVERGVTKCARYFPERAGTSKALGRYLVSNAATEEVAPDLVCRSLKVRLAGPPAPAPAGDGGAAPRPAAASRSRAVRHYHFAAWPDHGVPASPAPLLALCAELRATGAHAAPIVVHCSAGIGRSGVFCVLDVITRRLLALEAGGGGVRAAAAAEAVDVGALVAALRQQRLGMVQTREQFLFCHTALLHFVRELAAGGAPAGQPAAPAP